VPLNPAEPGFHWVEGCDGTATVVFWRGHGGDTHYENGDLKELDHWSGYPMWQAKEWRYLRPCSLDDLTPAEVDARVKEARRDALKKLERHFKEAAAGTPLGHENRQRGASTYNWLIYCASIISALGEKE
jgi:hypothetical protein